MNQHGHYISAGTEQLHYLEWGSGKKLLLAFHGYGNDAAIFKSFKYHLHDHIILSFDLPHHGASKWTGEQLLKTKDLVTLVGELKAKYKVDKVSLLGYSMGGRVCMTIVQHMPESVAKVVLLAADGLAINKLYYFCTRTAIGKKIFKDVLQRPDKYFRVIDWLRKANIINAAQHRLGMQHIETADRRRMLQHVWLSMSDLLPNPGRLKEVIKQHQIPVSIFMGSYDKIMPPSLAGKFRRGLDTVQVITLEKGHRLFDETNTHIIAEHLL
jgi:pimeloyl-ACP methyl ester carboxylesterase